MLQKKQIVTALCLFLMPVMSVIHAEPVQTVENKKSHQQQTDLDGYWVDLSGRGVLKIDNKTATFSVDGEANPSDHYLLTQKQQQLMLMPAPGSNEFNKPVKVTLNDENPSLQLKRGIKQYHFVPAPNITPVLLNGYWYAENNEKGDKNIRAIHYKNNASIYDYYWWRVSPGFGTYQTHIDKNVPLEIKHGFILTAPGANNDFLVYATKQEGDTIEYVDSNGDSWSESRTDSLYQFTPPEGFKELKGR